MTFQQAVEKFLEYYEARSHRSAITYRTGLNRFAEWLNGQQSEAGDLTSAQVRDFATWLANEYRTEQGEKLSWQSIHLYLVALLKFYDFLILNDIIENGDFVKTRKWVSEMIKKAKRPPIDNKLPEKEMVLDLLAAADQEPNIPDTGDRERRRLTWLRNRAIIYCLESSGARVGEIVALHCNDLVYKDRGAWVMGKGGKMRFARFSLAAWERLNEYFDARGGCKPQSPVFTRHDRSTGKKEKPLSVVTVERTINKLARETGILKEFHMTPHSLRHYFATRFLKHTGDLALTQDILGHANPATTRIYAKTTKEQIIEAHKGLFD